MEAYKKRGREYIDSVRCKTVFLKSEDCLGDGVSPLSTDTVLGVFLVLGLAFLLSGFILIIELFVR